MSPYNFGILLVFSRERHTLRLFMLSVEPMSPLHRRSCTYWFHPWAGTAWSKALEIENLWRPITAPLAGSVPRMDQQLAWFPSHTKKKQLAWRGEWQALGRVGPALGAGVYSTCLRVHAREKRTKKKVHARVHSAPGARTADERRLRRGPWQKVAVLPPEAFCSSSRTWSWRTRWAGSKDSGTWPLTLPDCFPTCSCHAWLREVYAQSPTCVSVLVRLLCLPRALLLYC
jgi:hypothetical protein